MALIIHSHVDILDAIFDILRREEYTMTTAGVSAERSVRYNGPRDLRSCALVSRIWRDIVRRHVFYELHFAFSYINLEYSAARENGEDGTKLRGITCCLHSGRGKNLYDLDRFLIGSHIAQYLRILRLAAHPHSSSQNTCSCTGADRTLFLRLLNRMAHLKHVDLAYVLINPMQIAPSPAPPIPHPSLDSLSLDLSYTYYRSEDRVVDILRCFEKIKNLDVIEALIAAKVTHVRWRKIPDMRLR
ncbi:uncharacterized protein PHACADRAFT_182557 [Phanerochaete carnosa HHB-10118-sp]|uniref:F-box domain-containing protein n=1 Tax=Phanerochaete carnosa (strain HHB-10118-sp) TaxID=650164 RepID=K5WFV0_PHACS|nr:uncharacterized protein PHACADRAFT_182557 [Phanerochaete carnosa HHB-10118-sp]EKM58190.1 hypothetical protein PHACADRAFT_182557 [Phanerochaete carnosa HHB-10118-sp]